LSFEIPENWACATFQDVFEITMGQSPEGSCINHTEGVEFHQGKTFFGNTLLKHSHIFTKNPTKIAFPDSLVICVRAPVGDVNITERTICIGRGLCTLKPLGGISSQFMLHWISFFKGTFYEKAIGTTFLAISGDTIKNQNIPIPPLAEQKRIFDFIKLIYSELDRIIAEL
jgi:type I restriction enzyme S subunit